MFRVDLVPDSVQIFQRLQMRPPRLPFSYPSSQGSRTWRQRLMTVDTNREMKLLDVARPLLGAAMEPLSAASARGKLEDAQLVERLAATVVFVSHEQRTANDVGQRRWVERLCEVVGG